MQLKYAIYLIYFNLNKTKYKLKIMITTLFK